MISVLFREERGFSDKEKSRYIHEIREYIWV